MRLILSLSFLFLFSYSYSQLTERQIFEKNLNIKQHQEELLLNASQESSIHNALPIASSREMTDNDQDGMDDQWEIANGLDPNDNTDARKDKDGDAIKNLFEFQLSTDPNSNLDPVVSNYDPTLNNFNSLLSSAEGGTLVLRMAQGIYFTNFLNFYNDNTRIMIQGGWNDDFTDHDHKKYPTSIAGLNGEEVLYLSTSSGISLQDFVLVLEGLEVTDGGGFFGNVNFITRGVNNAVLSLYNFKSTNSSSLGLNYHHWNESTGHVTMINSEFTGNDGYGIKNHTTGASSGTWKFYNLTISRNGMTGMRTFTLDTGNTEFRAANIISQENTGDDFYINGNQVVDFYHSNFTPEGTLVVFQTDINNIDLDPEFVDPVNGDYTLAAGSPCINSGLDVGLDFAESAPEIGAYEVGDIMSSLEETKEIASDFLFLSNPIHSGQNLQVRFTQNLGKKSKLHIYDQSGKLVMNHIVDIARSQIDLPALNYSGLYTIQLVEDDKRTRTKRFVVTE